jgi:hypothetical protein
MNHRFLQIYYAEAHVNDPQQFRLHLNLNFKKEFG